MQTSDVQDLRPAHVEGLRRPCGAGARRRATRGALPVPRHGTGPHPDVLVLPVTGDPLRVVIVGGVAGGMSTATRLRRLDATATITVLERSGHVSFANCGLPYFVGRAHRRGGGPHPPDARAAVRPLPARRPDPHRGHRHRPRRAHASRPDPTLDGTESTIGYDKLVLSMGAAPVRPPIPGYDRVRTLRTVEDAARLASDVDVRPGHRGGDRCRLHRARDGREPRRSGPRRHHRRGRAPGAAAARPRAGGARGRRARGPRRPRRDRRDGRLGGGDAP